MKIVTNISLTKSINISKKDKGVRNIVILNHIFEPKNDKNVNNGWDSFKHEINAYSIDLERQLINNVNASIKLINVDMTRFNVRLYYAFNRCDVYHRMTNKDVISSVQSTVENCRIAQLKLIKTDVLSDNMIEVMYQIVPSHEIGMKNIYKPINIDDMNAKIKNSSSTTALRVAIGVDENERPIMLNFEQKPNYLINGVTASGKTTFSKHLLLNLMTHYTPNEVKFTIINECLGEYDVFEASKYKTHIFNRPDQTQQIVDYLRELNKSIEDKNYHHTQYQIILVDELWHGAGEFKTITQELLRLIEQGDKAGIYIIITSSIGKRLLDLYPHMRDALQDVHIGELDTINGNDSRLRLKGTFILGSDEQLGQTPYVNDKIIKKKGGI